MAAGGPTAAADVEMLKDVDELMAAGDPFADTWVAPAAAPEGDGKAAVAGGPESEAAGPAPDAERDAAIARLNDAHVAQAVAWSKLDQLLREVSQQQLVVADAAAEATAAQQKLAAATSGPAPPAPSQPAAETGGRKRGAKAVGVKEPTPKRAKKAAKKTTAKKPHVKRSIAPPPSDASDDNAGSEDDSSSGSEHEYPEWCPALEWGALLAALQQTWEKGRKRKKMSWSNTPGSELATAFGKVCAVAKKNRAKARGKPTWESLVASAYSNNFPAPVTQKTWNRKILDYATGVGAYAKKK
eukprot:TRINITY_DN522_c0_g1_i5.p1 TRINITY_DN522_c0_g1~~TRINITY_DN522_c0_g1_i5.p1  ORF type:complete len:318 (+),score=110.35 TRINITY_DN522_c0_g1_i5:59-955(+)